MGYQFYELLLLFSIYSIIGWMIGVCGSALTKGIYVNHGICKGPYCPSYGLGALVILFAMSYLTQYNVPLTAFLAGLLIGTILEIVVMAVSMDSAAESCSHFAGITRCSWALAVLFWSVI